VRCAGIEGTSSYGAGLARHLKAAGISVMEVERPKRRHLRRKGKSDPLDAEAAARTVLAGEAVGEPKSGDGKPEDLRHRLRQLPTKELVLAIGDLPFGPCSGVLLAPPGLPKLPNQCTTLRTHTVYTAHTSRAIL